MNAGIDQVSVPSAKTNRSNDAANTNGTPAPQGERGGFDAMLGERIDAQASAQEASPAAGTAAADVAGIDDTATAGTNVDTAAATTSAALPQDAPTDASAALMQALAALGLVKAPAAVAPTAAAGAGQGEMQPREAGVTRAEAKSTRHSPLAALPADSERPGARPTAAGVDTGAYAALAAQLRSAAQAGRSAGATAAGAEQAEARPMAWPQGTDNAAALNPLVAASNAATNASTPSAVTPHAVDSRFGSNAWANEVTHKVRHFVLEKIEIAELQLNPPDLGPIRVEIALDQGHAAIHFCAARDDVRDALAQNVGNLRDSLSQAGVALQSATTGSFGEGAAFAFMQRQQARNGGNRARSGVVHADGAQAMPGAVPRARVASAGGVDLFA